MWVVVLNRNRLIFLALLLGICSVVGMCIGYVTGYFEDQGIVEGVYVDSLPLGGLSPVQAAQLLRQLQPTLTPIELVGPDGQSWQVLPESLGFVVDIEAMVDYAYGIGRRGTLKDQMRQRMQAAQEGVGVPWILKAGDEFTQFLNSLAQELYQPPQDASFQVLADDTVTIIPAQWGRGLELERAALLVKEAVCNPGKGKVQLPMIPLAPKLTTEDAENCGIVSLLASFTTRYDPTETDRAHKVALAAATLDGTVLHRGEVFSFNARIGPRTAARGYRNAPVIIDGELQPDIGGGVCQVSSTLYAAAVLADLTIVERHPHSVPVTYLPLGQDATVVDAALDLKFRNDLDHCILIKAQAQDGVLTVRIYGARPQFIYELVSRVEQELPIPTVYRTSATLSPGQQVVEKPGARGLVVSVWKVKRDAQGVELGRSLVNRSTYPARPRVIVVPQ